MSAVELYVHPPSRCWSNHSPGQTFPGALSGFQHRLSGTYRHEQRLSVNLYMYVIKLLFNRKVFTGLLSLKLRLHGATDYYLRQRSCTFVGVSLFFSRITQRNY